MDVPEGLACHRPLCPLGDWRCGQRRATLACHSPWHLPSHLYCIYTSTAPLNSMQKKGDDHSDGGPRRPEGAAGGSLRRPGEAADGFPAVQQLLEDLGFAQQG